MLPPEPAPLREVPSLNFDFLTLAAVAAELRQLLGARAGRALQPTAHRVILPLRAGRDDRTLLFCTHPRFARVHFTSPAERRAARRPTPAGSVEPSSFLSLLRRRLDGARLSAVEQPELERILRLEFSAVDEVKGLVRLVLAAEVMGKHSNLVVVDESGTVLDALKRVTHRINRYRELLPGRPYLAPPARPGLDPRSLDRAGLEAALDGDRQATHPGGGPSAPLPARASPLQAWLLDHIQGLSPTLAREVAARAGLDPEHPVPPLAPAERDRLAEGLAWLRGALHQVLVEGRLEPTGYLDPQGRLLAFSALPLQQFAGLAAQAHPDMGSVLDAFYGGREERERLDAARQSVTRRLDALLDRLRRRLGLQEQAAAAGTEAEKLREWGELITAHLHEIPAGAASARVRGWEDSGEGPEVEVPLDPRRSPAANAQAYFRRYRRLQATGRGAARQAQTTRKELEYLEEIACFARQAETLEELEDLGRELSRAGYLEPSRGPQAGRPPAPGRKETPPGAASGPLTLNSADGLVIWVGRNSRQNDRITLRDAGPDDVWLHARGLPGSHVILRTLPDGSFPESSLLEAASLAAHFSQGRAAAKVEVDWTRRRHVRKPPGARPGMVIYDHQHTLVVRPAGPKARDRQQ